VRRYQKINVKIPPGVDTGSKLRIRGEGEAGDRGGSPGDLFIFIYVEPHEFFSREGDDILCHIPISFPQAALGAEIEIPTLDGKRKLSIPRGTESGDLLKLKGEGIPKLRGYGRGDQIFQVIVKTPKNLNKRQEELLREFEETGQKKGKEREEEKESWKRFFRQ
jgi:molecular chaperone DnaJ